MATKGYRLNKALSLEFYREPRFWYPNGWTTDVDLFDDSVSKARAATSNEEAQQLLQEAESFFWRSPRPIKAPRYPPSIRAAFDAIQKERLRFLKRRVALMIADGNFDEARELAASSAEQVGARSKPGKQLAWLRTYCEWRSGSAPVRSSRKQPHHDKNLRDWAIGFWLNYIVPITLEFRCERLVQLQNPNRLTSDLPQAAQLPLLLHSLDVRHPPDLTWPPREPTHSEIVVLAEAAMAAATPSPSEKQLVQAIRAIGLLSRMAPGSRKTALLEISRHPDASRAKVIRQAVEKPRALYQFQGCAGDKALIVEEIVAAIGPGGE